MEIGTPDTVSSLVGVGLILMAISGPITVAILKLAGSREKKLPCNSCDKLDRSVAKLEQVIAGLNATYQDTQNFINLLKDIRRHILAIEGGINGSD